jgi:hypothetical protein
VTIILMGTTAAPTVAATVSITGNANVTLAGQTGTTYQDLIFYEDPTATGANGGDQIAGNGTVSLSGVIDFRNDSLKLAGNGISSPNDCLKVIAGTITSTGNGSLNSSCVGTGANPLGPSAGVRLVQ